jgi:multidrug transporter EmrE-like cation transporter
MVNFILSIHYGVWLVVSALFFATGEFLSKKFALGPTWTTFVFILMVYLLGVLAWLPAIVQKNRLSIVGTIWSVLSLLATVLIGTVLFREKLGILGVVGVVTAVISVVLLSMA